MQTIVVIVILMAVVFFLIRRLIRTLGKSDIGGCGCGCEGCDTMRRE